MTTIVLGYTSDLHGRAGILKDPPSNIDFWLDGGDALVGSHTVFKLEEPNLKRLRNNGCRAQALGNRELNYLRSVMYHRQQERAFPVLAANLTDLRNSPPWPWEPYSEFEVAGVKVGCIGLTVIQYPVGHFWEPILGYRFLEPQSVLPDLVKKLRARVDVLLVMSHLGIEQDMILRPYYQGADLLLGGHSHTLFHEPRIVDGLPYVHIGSHGSHWAKVTIESTTRVECSVEVLES